MLDRQHKNVNLTTYATKRVRRRCHENGDKRAACWIGWRDGSALFRPRSSLCLGPGAQSPCRQRAEVSSITSTRYPVSDRKAPVGGFRSLAGRSSAHHSSDDLCQQRWRNPRVPSRYTGSGLYLIKCAGPSARAHAFERGTGTGDRDGASAGSRAIFAGTKIGLTASQDWPPTVGGSLTRPGCVVRSVSCRKGRT